jgi:hypothetical protein
MPGSHKEPHPAAGVAAAADTASRQGAMADVAAVDEEWLWCLSLAGDLTTAVLHLGGVPQAVQPTTASHVSFQCAQLLVLLLKLLGKQAHGADTDRAIQLRQLQSVAYTLQLVEAALRGHAVSLTAQRAALVQGGLQPSDALWHSSFLDIGYHAARAALTLARPLALKASPAVLGSLQGQLLLQSCTSLLLTYSSQQLSADCTSTPQDLQQCVLLLQCLQQSEALAAAGGSSSCGISQSLAAGLWLVGRCLLLLEIGPLGTGDGSSSSASSPEQQGTELRAYFRVWMSSTATGKPLQAGDQINSELSDALRLQADVLNLAVRRTVACLESISQTLQQRAGLVIPPPTDDITAVLLQAQQAVASSSNPTSQAGSAFLVKVISSMGSGGSTSSSHEGHQHYSAGDSAAQQSSHNQQRQPPADWLLAGVHAAHAALQKVLFPLSAALTPYVVGWDPLKTPVNPHALPLPRLLAAAGEALCAAVPSSACCSNPRCTNLAGVTAGFALVRGKGCVCGGCLGLQAGGQGVVPRQGAVVAAR